MPHRSSQGSGVWFPLIRLTRIPNFLLTLLLLLSLEYLIIIGYHIIYPTERRKQAPEAAVNQIRAANMAKSNADSDMIVSSLAVGFTLGFGLLTVWEAIKQTRRSKNPRRSVYIYMIWYV